MIRGGWRIVAQIPNPMMLARCYMKVHCSMVKSQSKPGWAPNGSLGFPPYPSWHRCRSPWRWSCLTFPQALRASELTNPQKWGDMLQIHSVWSPGRLQKHPQHQCLDNFTSSDMDECGWMLGTCAANLWAWWTFNYNRTETCLKRISIRIHKTKAKKSWP